MAYINGGYVPDTMIEERNKRLKKILELLLNNPDGLSIKETAIDLGLPSESVRKYFKILLDDGSIKSIGKTGKTVIYTNASSEAPASSVQELPEHIGGRTFEEVKPAIHVNQGDIIWCSSRSGDGQFFRYLVMVPWERKATVLGIFPQGHPALNMNDARFVSIGVDPETGEELYADISNTCSRGYAQFGEKLMTISAENLAEVKRVMARYHRLDLAAKDQPSDIWKKRFEDLGDQLKKAKAENLAINAQFSCQNKLLTEANDDLKAKLKAAYLECDEKKQAWEEAQKIAKKALNENSELVLQFAEKDAQIVDLTECNERQRRFIEELKKQEAPEPVVSADTDALLWKISLLEQELKDKNEFITVLKQIVFKSLKGGE